MNTPATRRLPPPFQCPDRSPHHLTVPAEGNVHTRYAGPMFTIFTVCRVDNRARHEGEWRCLRRRVPGLVDVMLDDLDRLGAALDLDGLGRH